LSAASANLNQQAADRVAMTPREHPRLEVYGHQAREHIFAITRELGIVQIRPLLLSILNRFTPDEAKKAFQLLLSWSVRFLIAGGGGGGSLDRHYGLRAEEVHRGVITTARALRDSMRNVVPNNEVFSRAFASASVRRAPIARYYLRAIEMQLEGEKNPEMVPSQDTNILNLEHILPITPTQQWGISEDVASAYYKRLGNMTLLHSGDNVDIGNGTFIEKKPAYTGSPLEITKMLASYDEWTPTQIEERQTKLAEIAVKVWPLTWE
jgi:hypothetical protein